MKRIIAGLIVAAIVVGGAGIAGALVGSPEIDVAAANITVKPVKTFVPTPCTGADGVPYVTYRGSWTGSETDLTGTTPYNLTGTFTVKNLVWTISLRTGRGVIGADACWRRGLDWFGDAFGFSGDAMRAPDYAVLAVAGSAFGVTGTVNVAMTCDGNMYYGIGAGYGIGVDSGVDVSAVLAFGYVGDPDTVAPSEQDIDSFVSGETESLSISSVAAGFSYVVIYWRHSVPLGTKEDE